MGLYKDKHMHAQKSGKDWDRFSPPVSFAKEVPKTLPPKPSGLYTIN